MKTIKWGIMGTGFIASTFATALTAMEHTELAAVASRDIDRAKEFAERFRTSKAYGSYEELAKDPEIDVIYIATPHTEHKANATLCITNKKAVLCEKPFTLNQKDTQALITLAREYDVFLMEAMWTKFLPVTKTVKQWIKEKKIGEVKCLQVSFGFHLDFDPNHRLYNPALGGGALLDLGVYPITYAIYMMDNRLPDEVNSYAHMSKSNVDETNVISFKYKEGVLAQLTSSLVMNPDNQAVILGDQGRIVVPSFWMADKAYAYNLQGELIDTAKEDNIPNGYIHEAYEVNQCLREGKKESAIVPLEDTLEIMKVMDQLRSSWGLSYPNE